MIQTLFNLDKLAQRSSNFDFLSISAARTTAQACAHGNFTSCEHEHWSGQGKREILRASNTIDILPSFVIDDWGPLVVWKSEPRFSPPSRVKPHVIVGITSPYQSSKSPDLHKILMIYHISIYYVASGELSWPRLQNTAAARQAGCKPGPSN